MRSVGKTKSAVTIILVFGFSSSSISIAQDWVKTSAPYEFWTAIASSADGSKLVAVAYTDVADNLGPIYTSTNSGATWNPTSAPHQFWTTVTSSADGEKLAAASNLIYTS